MSEVNSRYLKRDTFICTILTILTTGIFYFFFINISFLDPFEKAFKDFSLSDVYYSENIKDSEVSNKIILVNVEHHDRLNIAKALKKIGNQSPKAIGIDIIFKDKKNAKSDSILKKALLNNDNIITSFYLEDNTVVKNDSFFDTPNQTSGFINLSFSDNESAVVRDFTGVKSLNDRPNYSLALQLAIKSGYIKPNENLDKFEDKLLINYTGNQSSFLIFEIDEILNNEGIPALKNSIVLLGYLGTPTGNKYDIEDKLFTPLNSKFVGKSVPDMYGLLIHANIVNMLIQDDLILKIPNFISYILAAVLCFFMTLFTLKIEKRSSLLYQVMVKLLQLVVTIILLYISIVLLKINVHLNITPIIFLTILGIEMVAYYVFLFHYLKKRFQWKSYLLDS